MLSKTAKFLIIATMGSFLVGPAQAFHKGVVHGGGEMPGEQIQTLDSLDCTTDQIARFDGFNWVCDGAPKTVFITSGEWNGDLMTAGNGIDGLSGADNLCQAAANRTNNVPAGTYIAWLSDSVTDARDRLPANTVGYILPDGTKVADDKADLLDGTLDHAIDQDEFAGPHQIDEPAFTWTGSGFDGVFSINFPGSCADWTLSDNSDFGAVGVAQESVTGTDWTAGLGVGCIGTFALYCFQK